MREDRMEDEEQERDEGFSEPFTIASVEPDLKRRYRYLIYTEGREEPVLSVHEDILVRYRLFKGQLVEPGLAREIAAADVKHQAYVLAVGYLGAKPRTGKELARYLKRKELPPEAIESALERLRREKLVDDEAYAKQFAEQRLRSHLKGSRLIRQELLQRGVGREEAAEALGSLDPEDERDAALRVARKKWPYLKGEGRERRQRLALFLARRGYPAPVVREALKQVGETDGGRDDLDEPDDGHWLDN